MWLVTNGSMDTNVSCFLMYVHLLQQETEENNVTDSEEQPQQERANRNCS